MNKYDDLLIEIGVEELPTAAVTALPTAGADFLRKAFQEAELEFKDIQAFATPRRLAWKVEALQDIQADRQISRRGPALTVAKDEEGHWTKAALGFARSCEVAVDELTVEENEKGRWLQHCSIQQGQRIDELLPAIFHELIKHLPIAKQMRWSDHEHSFVRPVLSLVVLYGEEIIPLDFFGIYSDRLSLGHRVHHEQAVSIENASDYEETLFDAKVIVSHQKRMEKIADIVREKAAELNASPVMPDELLCEVASLTEWPVAICGEFESRFLDIPQEVLITTMQDNQKYFALVDQRGKLIHSFIVIANIESKNSKTMVKGNEKVIRPRFADAEFFWQQDLQQPLEHWFKGLEGVVQHEKLGSIADKSRRTAEIAACLAAICQADKESARQAAMLGKCDLLSEMVMEFPELQGVMGRYYAEHDGLSTEICQAIEQQYWPKGSGAAIPEEPLAVTLALADKLETLIAGFVVGAKPSGSKDPFALRRMTIGILRIIRENNLDVDLKEILYIAASAFPDHLQAEHYVDEIFHYMLERLKVYYHEQGISVDCFQAVRALHITRPLDIDNRIQALTAFLTMKEAGSLLSAAKRIRNILRKENLVTEEVHNRYLQEEEERILWSELQKVEKTTQQALQEKDYSGALNEMAVLKSSVDAFFDEVMVMADDEQLKNNRLALLNHLQKLMCSVADLSELQVKTADIRLFMVDRDGVLNRDLKQYVTSAEELYWLPGVFEALRALQNAGWTLAVCTNQSGVERGHMTKEDLDEIHRVMDIQLEEEGVRIDRILSCTSADDDHPWRKPNPGMLLNHKEYYQLETLDHVPFVGDCWRDIQAAQAAGAVPILVRTGQGRETEKKHADEIKEMNIAVYDDLKDAVFAWLQSHHA